MTDDEYESIPRDRPLTPEEFAALASEKKLSRFAGSQRILLRERRATLERLKNERKPIDDTK